MRISTKCFEQIQRAYETDEIHHSKLTSSNFEDFVYGMYSEGARDVGLLGVERKILEQIGVAIKKMDTCAKNYPSIKKYVKNWMSSLKVTTLHCADQLATHTGVLGVAHPDVMPLFMDKNLYLPPESILTFINEKSHLNDLYSESRNTFIHEVFHLALPITKMFTCIIIIKSTLYRLHVMKQIG